MRILEYSPNVREKMITLKNWLTAHFDEATAKKVLTGITSDANNLKAHPQIGTNISELYEMDTDYWYLFTNQHYLIYRISPKKIVIIQMFHEREDFMMTLFGMSGRSQESIDYWGE